VRWLPPDEFDALNPAVAPGQTMVASWSAGDGYIDPPRNVLAYTAALFTAGVQVRERVSFTGWELRSGRVAGVRTSAGDVATERVVLTGGPTLAAVGRAAGVRIPAGGARHQVVVTAPHPDLAPARLPMVFDVASGIYWRPEEGGMLWGMSNPEEQPGEAHDFDWTYYEKVRPRMTRLVPVTADLGLRKAWAATIDFTPDHLPGGRRGGGRGRRARDDVGPGGGLCRRGPGAQWGDRRRGHHRPGSGPVRRGRAEPALRGPDRAAVPRVDPRE